MAVGAGGSGLREPACVSLGLSQCVRPQTECQNVRPWGVLGAPKRNTVNKLKRRLGLWIYTKDGGGRCGVWGGASGHPRAHVWPGGAAHAQVWHGGPGPRLRPGRGRLRPWAARSSRVRRACPALPLPGLATASGARHVPRSHPTLPGQDGRGTGKPDACRACHVTRIASRLGPWSR